jgi:hypothetical protein
MKIIRYNVAALDITRIRADYLIDYPEGSGPAPPALNERSAATPRLLYAISSIRRTHAAAMVTGNSAVATE